MDVARRVLVTGATGYIGRAACRALHSRGFDVVSASSADDLLATGGAERLVANAKADSILHLAWNVTPGVYWTHPDNTRWARATADLARAFTASGGRRFVGAGTCAEYDWSAGRCDERTTAIAPATPYGRAKVDAWRDVQQIAADSGASAAWGRIFWLFGGANEHPSRLVPTILRAIRVGEPALCTSGEQLRDFLHVDDVGDAFAALVASDVEGAVNIASGEPRRVRDVIEGVASRLGRLDLIRLGARPSDEVPLVCAAIDRLRDEIKWRPSMTFEEALDRAVG